MVLANIPKLVECMICGQMGWLVFNDKGEVTKIRFGCECPQLTESEMNVLIRQVNNEIQDEFG